MTTTKPDAINWCPECEIEYAAHRCAPCPLCPLRNEWDAADTALRLAEPWRIITGSVAQEIQEILNELTVAGWTRDSFHVSQQDEREGLRPVYVAVMRRTAYEPESHALRRLAQQKTVDSYFAKQDEIVTEVTAFRAARDGEAS